MFITIITTLYACDIFIDTFINNIKSLKDFEKHFFIFTNIIDSNLEETNLKIKNLKTFENIKIITKTKNNFTNIFDEWNEMIKYVKTDLVCTHRYQEKLKDDFLITYTNEFEENDNIDILSSPLYISKNLKDDFETKNLKIIYDKKEIFIYEKDLKNFAKIDSIYFDYQYKLFMMLNCITDNINDTKKRWCQSKNIDIFDFFKNEGTEFVDLNNLNLLNLPGRSVVCKIELFNKNGSFNYNKYNSYCDIELWLRFFKNNFKILETSYVIYFSDEDNTFYDENIKRIIIKKYHPIFKYINTKINVIIPYRNRKIELQLFLKNFRKTYDVYFDYNIVLCDQDDENDFCRGQLINTGVKYIIEKEKHEIEKSKLLITDVDLLYKKIPLDVIKPQNYKLYGISNLQLSTGGGSFICSQKSFIEFNGFSNKYFGWGSEDMDMTYRLFLSNIHLHNKNMVDREKNDSSVIDEIQNKIIETENKNKYCDKNNNIFVQQVINYNLYFYNFNKNKFLFNKDKIFYNNILFFEGKYELCELIEGLLYDLVSSQNQFPSYFIKKNNVLIYDGQFRNNKPDGYGIGYSLWNMTNYNLVGLWKYGYIKDVVDIKKYHDIKKNCISDINKDDYSIDKSFLDGLKENNYNIEMANNEDKEIVHLKIKIV
jgi:hypothetical protein